ncbi:natural killer cell receptor 2B4 isoform X3 [Theropithecus gelada]|uniref:natural killer cell receptor 2B4 isoform X3 n=1 Tax=Theropithecus gelada TaxID=9565 RepID=UPI000DC16ECA|nr:natural killer cell receptor 2B4 isoform X3 [Theropithecus gelada]
MLGQVVTFTLLLLLKGYQGKGCQGSADHVFSILGMPLQLQPNSIQTKIYKVQWKMWLPSQNTFRQILQWENGSSPSNTFNNRFSFIIKNLTLLIKAAQQQDSGLYCLEVTNMMGQVQRAMFQVFVSEFRFWPFLVIIVILSTLFLGTLVCFCVWRRKKKGKQSETCPKEFLTIYEEVKDLKTRRNKEQEQTFPGGGSTIYYMIQSQSSAPTSQEPAYTLYSLIQPSRKPGSRKRNHSPSFNSTIYEVIEKSQPKAQNPARLSRKELENFDVYS